jgi:hypothetical protein
MDQCHSPRGARRRVIVGASLAAGATTSRIPSFHGRLPRCHQIARSAQFSGTEVRREYSVNLCISKAMSRSNANGCLRRRWRNAMFKIMTMTPRAFIIREGTRLIIITAAVCRLRSGHWVRGNHCLGGEAVQGALSDVNLQQPGTNVRNA